MLARIRILLLFSALAAGCQGSTPPVEVIHGKTLADWTAALRAPDAKSRQKAVRALGNAGAVDERIQPLLIQALKDTSPLVRLEAVEALAKMGKSAAAALPALKVLLKDPDAKVRDQAGRAVKQLEAA